MKLRAILLTILYLNLTVSEAQEAITYSKVRIDLTSNQNNSVFNLPFEFEHAQISKNSVEIVLSENELDLLESTGFSYDIIHDDISLYYENRSSQSLKNGEFWNCDNLFNDTISVPQQFNFGTMGGYLTYSQLLLELDSMVMNYPNLITVKQQIDTFLTYENRPIYYVKISDNPNNDESSTESKVLYNALHHAREPQSMMQLVFYMEYLLENYGSNEKVTYIVDNLELYFVPCINPDGYVYNETTNPNGGGMWRKNRRDNGGSSYGVDLNRNYGYQWGINNFGSSPDSTSETYRGPSAFSEPETKALMYLCEHNNFKATLNYHSFGNVLIYPEGYESDSLRFVRFAQKLTQNNNYAYGSSIETVGYSVNGDSDSWMYNDVNNKSKQYSFTPETGSQTDAFWPPVSRIIPLCKENIWANINAALVVGEYVSVENISDFDSENEDMISLKIQSFGLKNIISSSIEVTNTDQFESIGGPISLGPLNKLDTVTATFNYKLNSSYYESLIIPFEFKLTMDNVVQVEQVNRIFSTQQPIYADRFDISVSDWDLDLWGRTNTSSFSAPYSMTDSPNGNYMSNFQNELVLNNPINLTNPAYTAAYIKFNAKWEIENGYDFLQIFIDDGISKTPLCGEYTNIGIGFNGQPDGEPLYDGIMKDWVTEYINISEYLGKVINISFLMTSDAAIEKDGFYFDNFKIYALKEEGLQIQEELFSNDISIQPNPAEDYIVLNAITKADEIIIINDLGQKVEVLRNNTFKNGIKINIANLDAGIYHVLVVKDGTTTQGKFFKR